MFVYIYNICNVPTHFSEIPELEARAAEFEASLVYTMKPWLGKQKEASKQEQNKGRKERGRKGGRKGGRRGEEGGGSSFLSARKSSSLFTPFLIYLKKLSFRPDRGRKPSWWLALQHLPQRTHSLAHSVRAVLRMLGDRLTSALPPVGFWLSVVCSALSNHLGSQSAFHDPGHCGGYDRTF